jgi:hypothetical protein
MNNNTTNSGKQQTRVRNIFELKTNVFHSGIEELRMCTSLAYRAAYVTVIYVTLRGQYWKSFLDWWKTSIEN